MSSNLFSMKSNVLFFLLVLILFSFSCKKDDSIVLTIEDCYIQEIDEVVKCGTFEVRENPHMLLGRKFKLNFIILPAKGTAPAPDPLFVFEGGPGYGTAALVGAWAPFLAKLRRERAVILVDQRGTGQSHPLPCELIGDVNSAQTYLKESFPEDFVKNCRQELEKTSDLRYYHTTAAMQDVDKLRDALGYERINIWGISYGGYAAIVYMKNYPERVRCAFLESPAAPYYRFPMTMASDAQEALERLFADCAADPDCSSDYPNLEQEFYEVLYRLQQGPVSVDIINPINNQPETVTFRHYNFIKSVRSLMFSAYGQSWLPIFIYWAYRDSYSPFVGYIVQSQVSANKTFMDGMYLCIACTDTVPYIDYQQAYLLAQGTFMGDYVLEHARQACEWWVRGKVPEGFHELPTVDVPTLIITGDLDSAVRPYEGEEIAGNLPYSFHYVIPNNGHGCAADVWYGCLEETVIQFFRRGSIAGIDPGCADNHQRPPWVSWRDFTTQDKEKISKKISSITSNTR